MPKRAISPARTPRKDAIVMTATSRWATWESSCASTASSSALSSRSIRPVVTHTTAFFGLRPVANAFGIRESAIATRGFGMSARAQSRSITPCRSGASSGSTTCAPMAASAILSEKNHWATRKPAAMITTQAQLSPAVMSPAIAATYSRPSRNMTRTMRVVRPRSGRNRVRAIFLRSSSHFIRRRASAQMFPALARTA